VSDFAGRRMSPQINHVSVNARLLQESVDFYVDLLGAELIPTPNFGLPVQWLALGPHTVAPVRA
jgi:catechol 2,3-dioxygenase-like lactoylglutathione lyase family enzyme